MSRYLSPALRALTLAACALLMSACGGGDEGGGDAAYSTSTGNATPSAAVIAQGKTLYNQYCAQCHGGNMPNAKNSGNTLNAIASNRGGMSALATSVKTTEADDIASYLAFGL